MKVEIAAAIDALLAPMRERRARFDAPGGGDILYDIIRTHSARANAAAAETLGRAREAMKLRFVR